MKPYQQTCEDVIRSYATNETVGLTEQEAAARLKKYGLNALPETGQDSWLAVFIRQFQNPLIYVLLIAATIIFFVGPHKSDAFIISGVLFFNAIVGMIQEGRTRNILLALRYFARADSLVVRDGTKKLIGDSQLVVGDLLLLREGQKVPADARIIASNTVALDESMLTGESLSIRKTDQPLYGDLPVFEQTNMVFRGTYVVAGSCKAVVTATGTATELGKIHRSIEHEEETIPLRKELNHLSYSILLGILGMCGTLFVIGFLTGKPLRELLVMLTALFICVIPEGLPVVLTLVLVTGAYRMTKKNVLVKNLQAVEGLGRIDVIVIDKTGTLTRNEMMVSRVYDANGTLWQVTGQGYYSQGTIRSHGNELPCKRDGTDFASWMMRSLQSPHDASLWHCGAAASLLNNAEIVLVPDQGIFEIKGDPTEAALAVFSQKLGFVRAELDAYYCKLSEIPFDPIYRYHAGFYRVDDHLIVYVIGSPETIIARCNDAASVAMQKALNAQLADGLRTVAIAMKSIALDQQPLPKDPDDLVNWKSLIENNLTFLGLCGIEDAIRTDINHIVEQARNAGLQVIMATGDHRTTALYIAKKTGIFREGDTVLEGADLERLSETDLARLSNKVSVYARVAPEQKLKIIHSLQKRGLMVAMTGDGINDAPSLVAADLGIGMGRIGTEVAKQASDMILLDDAFESIINAIEQGRHIFYTLRRVILYFFATNMGEVLIVLFALVAGLPLPITAAQILWLNLVTDGFLDIALSMEPQEGNLLGKQWRYRGTRLVDANLWLKTMFMAIPMGLGSLWVFMRYYQTDLTRARTMTLLTMAMFQWFNAWSCRSTTKSVFQLGFFSNPWLVGATCLVLLLQVALLYVPFMQALFATVPLTAVEFCWITLLASSVLVLEELRKAFMRWWVNNGYAD